MKHHRIHPRRWSLLLLLGTLGACGSGDEYDGFDAEVSSSEPDGFLTFFNRQGDLAAGNYTLVVGTDTAGQAGTFSVSIRRSNSSAVQVEPGSWTNSGGQDSDPTCASGNACIPVALNDAIGLDITLNTTVDGVLYLVDDSDTPRVVASANANGAGGGESLSFSESEIDETDFATAYYAEVDPGGARNSAQGFLQLHGFGDLGAVLPGTVHAIFRDSKDLGYGRDMYMRSYPNPDCPGVVVAFFVRNFSVQIVEGFAYGPVNLEAAIAEDLTHHVGSNAIEFSTGRTTGGATDTCSPEPMAKFYTYEPDYTFVNAPHPLRTRVDLDARGEKAMPQPCISCHGGKLRPVDRDGNFVAMHAADPANQFGDTKARMQAFEVDTFEFSDQPGHTRADYEEPLRLMNAAVYCTYPDSDTHPACTTVYPGLTAFGGLTAQTDPGEWSGDFAREVLDGWYGNTLETAGSAFDDSFVPADWTPSVGGPPTGADILFTKVVGPNCFVCHGKRGNELGSDTNASGDGKDVDFSSWEKFISHADEIERLVYDEGKMPMGLLNYQNFWNDPEKAELLASFIAPYVTDSAGFDDRRTDGAGNILLPGRPVARAGPDRVTLTNAPISLNAQASLFSNRWDWTILSVPAGSSTDLLSSSSGMRVDFEAMVEGEYILQLTTMGDLGSDSDTLTVRVDNTLPKAPRDLTFYADISTRLDNCATTCHSVGGGTNGGDVASVPVWWSDDGNQPFAVPPGATASLGLYELAMARINLEYIEDSLILKKPSGLHHYGGVRSGFDIDREVGNGGRADYDMFVNWIAEGAPCGGTAVQCAQ